MSTAIQLHSETMGDWSVIRQQAEVLVKTGFLPQSIKTPEQAMAIILTGRELGIGAMAALNTINVIQGKPTISPQLMLALINRSGQVEDIRIETGPQGATCTIKRKGRTAYTAKFGPTEAAAMQLSGKDNYKKQGPTMYKWRAVADAARATFADVLLGLYTPDEMGAQVNVETGEVVGSAIETKPQTEYEFLTGESLQEEAEPEPVRNVKLEGAQPTSGQHLPEGLEGAAGHVVKLANSLGWNESALAQCIEDNFGVVVDNLKGYLEFASKDELRELYRIMNSQPRR